MTPFKVALVRFDNPPLTGMPSWVEERLADEGIDFVFHQCETDADVSRFGADADVLWVSSGEHVVTAQSLDGLNRCGAVLRTGVGVDNIPVAAATKRGIIVVNTPQPVVEPVAEHTISLLFAVVRQLAHHDRLVRAGSWLFSALPAARRYKDGTLGLIGFGRIARQVVLRLEAFGMVFLAYDPLVDTEAMREFGVKKVGLEELLRASDFVAVLCPLTETTYHLIGEPELRLMRPSAVLVNTARGAIVDEKALCRGLKERWIGGAGLDVLETEPPQPDNALFELDNVLITPHTANFTDLWPDGMFRASCEAIVDLAHGRWPESVVNREVVPRWDLM